MQLAPGTVFAADYRIVRPLSAGGMGAVYLVEQLSTGKPRALKLMHRELVYDPASRQHFEQEARVGARIASEHVVEVQAAGVDAATQLPYLVMELLEGEDMATRLRRGPFTLVEAATVFEQLGHALGAAHDAGVVHRDLKPDNIFLAVSKRTGAQLTVKVLDFGIAKVSEGQPRTTAAFGTPLWLAPEQTERGVITPAADVWAMGLIAFVMLTGHVFWRGGEGPDASVTRVIREIVFDPIPPASARAAELGATLPLGFDAWLARCLQRDPRARFANAREAYQALAPVLRGVATAWSETPPARGGGSLVYALAGAAVALLLVSGAAAGFLFLRGRAEPVTAAADAAPIPTAASSPPAPTTATTAPEIPSGVPDLGALLDGGFAFPFAPGVAGTGGGALHFGCVVQSSNVKLRSDAEDQFNGALSPKLDACLAAHPPAAPSGALPVVAHVSADGSVADVQVMGMMVAGPLVPCVRDVVKEAHFGAIKRATDVTFALFWMKS